ncbi:hypothetical protein O6R08_02575 [Cutibacterium equinum]|uniref:Uncharacterized protein n=1 Tax=Cutibacterium equinum TaxID=3016342 RepID=A0ABY7R0Z2_9ACTN|nr:hypothetical protein [Cutibacterium equinum]WCC80427.1 hypothetical protein O6R08_02575 [Cutibacterium equinum]
MKKNYSDSIFLDFGWNTGGMILGWGEPVRNSWIRLSIGLSREDLSSVLNWGQALVGVVVSVVVEPSRVVGQLGDELADCGEGA